MTTEPKYTDAQDGKPKYGAPQFGDWFRGIYASETNPQRDGMYVRTVRRTGKLNPGTWYEFTDGKGAFWQYEAKSTISLSERQAAMQGRGGEVYQWRSVCKCPPHDKFCICNTRWQDTTQEYFAEYSKDATDDREWRILYARAALQPPQPVRSVSDELIEAVRDVLHRAGPDREPGLRAALGHFATIAQEKQS